MLRINCHSAFKHYEMFHGSCGSDSNYGSIFNTTYNINCGGHGGGFWSGFGAGLGNAFGNIFSGMFGGGMGNFGFGNFGMSNFGFGGFGGFGMGGLTSPWFNSMGNFGYGRGNVNNTSNNTDSNTSSVLVDKDNAIYNKFEDEVNKLIKKNDAKAAKKLYDKIKAKQEKPEDSINEGMNKGAYSHLMTRLEKAFPELNLKDDKSSKTIPDRTIDDAPTASTQEIATDGVPAAETTVVDTGAGTAPTGLKDDVKARINAADSLAGLENIGYDDLDDNAKQAYLKKAIELAKNDNKTSPEQLRKALEKMPREVKAKVKESFYEKGYSNVEADDLNAEMLKKLKDIIDTSKISDFENITVDKPVKDDNGNWKITVKTYKDKNDKTHDLNVTYAQVEIIDGEIIFHGKQTTQKYVLQKDNEGKLHLMQYKYHEGYNVADVKRNK